MALGWDSRDVAVFGSGSGRTLLDAVGVTSGVTVAAASGKPLVGACSLVRDLSMKITMATIKSTRAATPSQTRTRLVMSNRFTKVSIGYMN